MGETLGKRELNRLQRLQDLQDAGLELFLTRGIEPVTIDELAKAGGMAKGNFYRYFADKGALVGALMVPVARRVRRVMRRCSIDVGRAKTTSELTQAYVTMALGLASIGQKHPRIVQLYLQENRTPATPTTESVRQLHVEMREGAVSLTELAVDHGLLRVPDARVSALAVIGAVEGLALSVVRGELDTPPQHIAAIVIGMVMEGIRATSAE